VCIELRPSDPDFAGIGGMMRRFFPAVALQARCRSGRMQLLRDRVLTIVIMARFVSGL
jgi:hypothetical protein